MYVFTRNETSFNEIVNKTLAAGVVRNDTIVHGANLSMPFGGCGSSGYGNYRGRFSFETFTHAQSMAYRPCLPGSDFNNLRCHPLSEWKQRAIPILMSLPYIPKLYLGQWAIGALSLAVFLYLPWAEIVRNAIATILEGIAMWLREPLAGV